MAIEQSATTFSAAPSSNPVARDLGEKIQECLRELSALPDDLQRKYVQCLQEQETDLVKLVYIFIQELVEDSTFVIKLDKLPDQASQGKNVEENAVKRVELAKKEKREEESKNEDVQPFSSRVLHHPDLDWKFEMVRAVLEEYNEPMLNLHFFGPFLKNFMAS